jgi:hypothetical protein
LSIIVKTIGFVNANNVFRIEMFINIINTNRDGVCWGVIN